MFGVSGHNGNVFDVSKLSHARLRILYLDLVAHTGLWIRPIDGGSEPAGVSSLGQSLGHLRRIHTKLSCQFTINLNIYTGIVERLFKAEITQLRDGCNPVAQLLAIGSQCGKIVSRHGNFYRGRRSKIHDLAYKVAGFEGKRASGKLGSQDSPEFLLEPGHIQVRSGP